MKMLSFNAKDAVRAGFSRVSWRGYNQVGSPNTAPISSVSGEVAVT